MHISTNLSHWVCVLAGLYLVLTGLVLRDVIGERPPRIGLPAAGHEHDHAWHVAYSLVRRGVMIAVGLAATLYGISRLW